MAICSYRDLIVWQKSIELTTQVYRMTKEFPREELYGLTSQLRRAVVSIPANIAEGYHRNSRQDYSRFCSIAFSSGAEVETLITIAKRLCIIDGENLAVDNLVDEVMRMLNKLIKELKN